MYEDQGTNGNVPKASKGKLCRLNQSKIIHLKAELNLKGHAQGTAHLRPWETLDREKFVLAFVVFAFILPLETHRKKIIIGRRTLDSNIDDMFGYKVFLKESN